MKDYVSFECTHFAQADYNDPDERRALAYADIDGYPADENEEGTVICRIWLMKEKDGIYPGYLVDWHLNAYRMNEEVKNLINETKKDLTKYVGDLKEQVLSRAYQKYKLKCMLEKGFTLNMLITKLQELMDADKSCDVIDTFESFEDSMWGGELSNAIWQSRDIFSVTEWKDEDYMREILDAEDYAVWKYKI